LAHISAVDADGSAIHTGHHEGLMLVRHLLCGIVIGLLAATAGMLAGFSVWAVVGCCVLGANVGLGASVLGALSHRPYRVGELDMAAR
jgi:hypothetical protein